MLAVYSYLVLAALIYKSNGEEGFLPPYIKPCNFNDKDLAKCIKEQIEISLPHFSKGIPEIGLKSLDPINLGDIVIDGNGLNLTFHNTVMHGISNSKLTDFKLVLGKVDGAFSLTFKTNLRLTAKYVADGKILILPIQGNGDAEIKAEGCEVTMDSKLVQVKDEKGDHLKLVEPKYKYTIERTVFDLKNLFNGNKQLADATIQFANENWQQLMDELAPPAIKTIVTTVLKAINRFFAAVTIQQIINEYPRS